MRQLARLHDPSLNTQNNTESQFILKIGINVKYDARKETISHKDRTDGSLTL